MFSARTGQVTWEVRPVRYPRGKVAVALAAAGIVAGCAAGEEPEPMVEPAAPSPFVVEPPPSEAEARVPEDLRAKVASLMVVGVSDYGQARAALDQGVGGLFIPSWADPALLTEPGRDIAALRAEYHHPFSVAVDFEGGRVQRHSEVFGTWMAPRDLAAQPPQVIRGTGYDIGRALRARGVNVDYAPVLDVDVSDMEIVGDRAFSGDPQEVARVAELFSQGLIDAGVTPTFKHFPGHGRASGDTHLALSVTPPLGELHGLDLVPYGPALESFPAASVMVGHMIVPGLGAEGVPSSLNPEAYRILREGDYPGGVPFDGVAITDDLSGMRGLLDYAPTAEAVERAIAAGADQALWSSGADVAGIIDRVTAATAQGAIPAERIDEAAVRCQEQLLEVGL
ncbi:glycoside hydrolase family 3 N-terminal domain-containing protein [Corynebacterium timonense]|uniref:beta-N-acetylhexosaminidase n=1 Tax=Corynebacterium timonense TaxID=441500 RepID=A0A1H1VDM3_9CORY|nr:glycoside hydrolase family 3 N-terminal domain-containing protein [Corynebacterium timonense]SDS82551.1 beta-N-acetylhexosaminidase [Corynebacterium timonense]